LVIFLDVKKILSVEDMKKVVSTYVEQATNTAAARDAMRGNTPRQR